MRFTRNNKVRGRERGEKKYKMSSKGVHRKREMEDGWEALRKLRHTQNGTKEDKI